MILLALSVMLVLSACQTNQPATAGEEKPKLGTAPEKIGNARP